MANTKITTNVIADDAVTSAKIADDAVGNDQLASGLTLGGNTTATLSTAAQTNITSVGTLTTLTVDNVIVNGTTIGHTSDTDLMTLADGVLTVAGELDATSLDISGNADIDGTLETDNLTVGGAQGSDGQVLTSTGSGVAWEDAAGGVAGISSSADATAITIDSSERVGIGTSSPAYTLDVNGTIGVGTTSSGQSLIQMLASTSGSNTIHFGDATSGSASYQGYINYAHSDNSLQFGNAGAEKMRIASDGKVAIGQTDASNAQLVVAAQVASGDLPVLDFDGYGNRGDGASQSINFRMGRTGQATDQGAQIRSIFQGGGATAGQTAIGFEFRPINENVVGTSVRFSGTGQRIQFWSDEIPHSNNPITNQAFVIGPSSSGAITSGLTNSTVLLNRSGELYAVDSSHNNTQITPHNWGLISSGPSEELAWTYYSQRPNPSNSEQIQTINVDMAKVVRKVEDLVGEKLIYTENSDKDGHTFQTIISDIQTTLADLKSRIETLEG